MPESLSRVKRFSPYLLGVTAAVVMAAARVLLNPLLQNDLPFITLFPAVFFAAWLGGLGPSVVTAMVGGLLALFFFIPPVYSLDLSSTVASVGSALFMLISVAVGWLGGSRLRMQARAESAARQALAETARAEEEAIQAEEETARAEEERLRADEQTSRAEQSAVEAESALAQQLEAESALRESEERYRAFIEQTAEGVWRFELERPVPIHLPADEQIARFYEWAYLAECNNAVAHMYGFQSAGELIGTRLGDMMPQSHPQNLDYLRAFVSSGYRLTDAESQEQDREGNERYFLNNLIGIVRDGHLLRAWGSQRDVTASRQAKARIQASEARFRSIFESGMIGIAFWNGERITRANDALLEMLGYTRMDLEDGMLRHGRLTPSGYEEADRRATEETRAKGSCTPYEKEFLRKDGSRVPVLVGGARVGSQLDDAVFFVLDQTERRRAEDQLRQAERIEVVGQLAGGMAHEANNQMSVVMGATSFILGRSDLPDAVRQDVEYIQQAAERTASITRQLLAFSRRQILQPHVIDLNNVLTNLQPILRRTLTEQHTLVLKLAPGLAPIRADPIQLDQVLLNLTINARDAMPESGTLTIETRNALLSDDNIIKRAGTTIVQGTYASLIVSDTGHGMDRETLSHLFEPFFTTKAVGQGTGLGLAMVYGIVKQSGGHIWAYSEPGLGTSIKIYFPSVADAATPEPRGEEVPLPTGSGTILVVEDDPLVRKMARRALTLAGYQVLEAANGREALALVEADATVDAVLTDLAMPELGGRELARLLQQSRPDLPIVFMSGYTDDLVARRGLLESGVQFLEKPLSPHALAAKMREALDGIGGRKPPS